MGIGDVSWLTYDQICNLCIRYFKGSSKNNRNYEDVISRINKSSEVGVTKVELENLLENFKIDILNMLSSQLDVFLG